MQEINGDIWELYDKGHYAVIMTNCSVYHGKNPMGGGTALQAARKFVGIEEVYGQRIQKHGRKLQVFENARLIMFPTKTQLKSDADIATIEQSAQELRDFVDFMDIETMYLPRPGVGLGGLTWDEVKPVLESIFDHRFIIVDWNVKA